MAIIINLDVQLAKRKVKASELAEHIGITPQNLSILKNGKAKALRVSTLNAICDYLQCQPGDIIEHIPDHTQDTVTSSLAKLSAFDKKRKTTTSYEE